MTERSKDLSIYYNFSDRCDDSMELMTKVLKQHFTKKKPSRILYQLEYTIINEYIETMKTITDDEINIARNKHSSE